MDIKYINLNEIEVRENSRLNNGDISGLAKSIEENGLLQPIVLKEMKIPSNGHKYQIVIGHRRFTALKKLKHKKALSIVYQNLNDKGTIIRNLVENLQRENVGAAEIGRYYHKLMKEFDMDSKDIAKELGIPEHRVKTAIDVYSFVPREYRDKVKFVPLTNKNRKDTIPATTAKKVLEIEREQRLTVDDKSKLFDAASEGKVTKDKLKLVGVFLKYGMEVDDAIKLSDEYDIVRIYVPIKRKEIQAAMDKHKIKSKRKLFRDILAGDLKITFNIPKWSKVN